MRKLLLALASVFATLLAFAAAAPAANHATVTASKSLAKGCQTKYFGNRSEHRRGARAVERARAWFVPG